MSRKKKYKQQPKNIEKAPNLSFNDINSVDEQIQKLQIVKHLALKNAINSHDVDEIYKAQNYIQSIEQKDDGVKPQSLLLDPQSFGANGYKDKAFRLSFDMLRAMANVPVIKAIIETRKEQVCEFMEPQKDKYSKGFIIRPKNAVSNESGLKLNKQEEARVQELTDFMMNCGNVNKFEGDNLNLFTRKVIHDALSLDQACFENVRNVGGELCQFVAVDGATIRLADQGKKDQDNRQNYGFQKGEKYGYLPSHVQVYQGRIIAEFYPWELCFGVRNPSSSIMANGYGRSELEDLVQTITAILNADLYNANYFKVGSNPKGILKVSGGTVNQGRIQEFKNHWQATMAGVANCIDGDTVIFTTNGGFKIKDLVINDSLTPINIWTGEKFEQASVFKTGKKKICTTKLNNGLSITTSPDHKFMVLDENSMNPVWKEQKDLKNDDFLLINKNKISIKSSIKYNGLEVDSDLWEVIGWMIGDGYLADGSPKRKKCTLFYHPTKECDIIDRHLSILEKYGVNCYIKEVMLTNDKIDHIKTKYGFKTVSNKQHRINVYDCNFYKFLQQLGFNSSKNGKIIPSFLFTLESVKKCAFLRGFFSADGHNSAGRHPQMSITSPILRSQTRQLLLTEGIRCSLHEGKEKTDFGVTRTGYRLLVKDRNLFFEKIGFIQPHKQPIDRKINNEWTVDSFPVFMAKKIAIFVREYLNKNKIKVDLKIRKEINDIVCGTKKASFNCIVNLFKKVNLEIPSWMLNYNIDKIVDILRTDDEIDMYDVTVYDDKHAFIGDGFVIHNSHKLMVIEADKMDFINTQASNKDMEYGKYQEFLIKIACAHYKIDPAEIGFPMSGSTDGKSGLGGDNTKDKTEASKDKGLKPLVKAYFNWLNIYILSELDPDYEMVPMGLDSESLQQDLANDVLAVQNWCTVNEIRRKRGLKDLPNGDIILNPIIAQMEQMKMMSNQESSNFVDENDKKDTKKSDEEDKLVSSLLQDVERILTEEYTNN